MKKLFFFTFCFAISNFATSDEVKKEESFCVFNDATYSTGSVIKDNDSKLYRCTIVYEKNLKKSIAWVQFEVGSKGNSEMILVVKP